MKYLTYIILLVTGIAILFFSFYVQIKHQQGYYKSEIPKELHQEVIKEYKEIRGIESIQTPTDSVQGTESEVEQKSEPSDSKQQSGNHTQVSWYDQSACGNKEYGKDCYVANYPELFDEEALTVAHRSLEFGTVIKFVYSGTEVQCRVNDRGPFVSGREFDLSYGCAKALGIVEQGIAKVSYQIQ